MILCCGLWLLKWVVKIPISITNSNVYWSAEVLLTWPSSLLPGHAHKTKHCGGTLGQGEELTLSYHLQAEFVFQTPLRMRGFSLSARRHISTWQTRHLQASEATRQGPGRSSPASSGTPSWWWSHEFPLFCAPFNKRKSISGCYPKEVYGVCLWSLILSQWIA